MELETLRGTVEAVIFSNEETGFTVFELDAGESLITVVGELPGVGAGEELVLTGRHTSHPTYGRQFKAELCERKLPATANAILKYLSSGAIKGIGPKTAAQLVGNFGDRTLEIIEKEPEKLTIIRGVSQKKAMAISEEYRHIFGIRAVMLYLAGRQVDPAAAIRIWKEWGTLAPEVIEQNPYQLCAEQIGIPFEKADEIALDLGFDPENPARLRAALLHVLRHNLGNGHTCLPKDKLLEVAAVLIEAEGYKLEQQLFEGSDEGVFTRCAIGGAEYVYLPELYEAERYIAGRFSLLLGAPPAGETACDQEIDTLEKEFALRYAQLQRKAISMALGSGLFILTGGPGTGKTTALNAILSILERRGEKVALAAPTGRAAKRMSEVTGREAKTIHRLLEVDFRDDKSSRITFKRNEKNLLRYSTIIVDEVSMVDTRLLHSLLKAMKLSTRLVLVGDPDQLPSVGAGNILRDLIQSDMIPTVHLSEIFRQAAQSQIVANAHRIVRGEKPELLTKDNDFFFLQRQSYEAIAQSVVELCESRLPNAYGFSPMWDIQVVAPSRVGALGTFELNRLLQSRLNPADPARVEMAYGGVIFREGDKVMQVRNNYDLAWTNDDREKGAGVFNGDIGIIEMLDRPSQTILIRYDDRVAQYAFDQANELEHAYAITVHKSQGSEFEAVVMPLMAYHSKLYYRNILYTGVTRAKKVLILLGKPDTVYRMVANHRKVLRYTNLTGFLLEGLQQPRKEGEGDGV